VTHPTVPERPVPSAPGYAKPDRSANEIRRDLVRTREELTRSLEALRNKVGAMTDVKRQFREHRTEILAGAAIAGFVVGGIVALRRRRY
jgi:hypothetical protein